MKKATILFVIVLFLTTTLANVSFAGQSPGDATSTMIEKIFSGKPVFESANAVINYEAQDIFCYQADHPVVDKTVRTNQAQVADITDTELYMDRPERPVKFRYRYLKEKLSWRERQVIRPPSRE